jgi:hypothetical protein
MSPIPIHVAIEDDLSELVIRKLLSATGRDYFIGTVFGGGGFGYLKKRANNWNAAAAAGTPILLLTDLDSNPCPSRLISDWLDFKPHANLLFRVAVREVESWLLADRVGLSRFLGISDAHVPLLPDEVPDPKLTLVNLGRRSRIRAVRESIVPRRGSTAVQGPNYNGCLGGFVRDRWNRNAASQRSPSLTRAWEKLMSFEPQW